MGVILGKPAKEEDYADLRRKIADTMREENSAGNYNEFRRLMGITERFDEDGRALPLDFQDRLLAEQMFIVGTTLPREEDA